MLIFDDDVLYQLYILVKNRGEMKGLIPVCNKLEPITVKIANATDVAEVVHGKWIDDGDCFHCSVCNKSFGFLSEKCVSNFCPNCGAKMDKE